MERIFARQNQRNILAKIILLGTCFLLLFVTYGLLTYSSYSNIAKLITAPINPETSSSFAIFKIDPIRQQISDPLTGVIGYGNQLYRVVSRYSRLAASQKELILIPVPLLDSTVTQRSYSLMQLNSTTLGHTELYDDHYKIDIKYIPEDFFQERPDLIYVPPKSPTDRWQQIQRNTLFIGADPAHPADGNYEITYHTMVVPSFIVIGAVNNEHIITPRYIVADRKMINSMDSIEYVRNQIIMQHKQITTLFSNLLLFSFVLVLIISLREFTPPLTYKTMWKKIMRLQKYDIFLIPLIIFIPQTLTAATYSSAAFIGYLGLRLLLSRAKLIIQQERIYLYG
ncbi:MAG: hypothetical protein FJ161_01580 [Gammaproteobacteria bacterium]|nr:hypothetical protein [Gammaproteobacteria bacterium]